MEKLNRLMVFLIVYPWVGWEQLSPLHPVKHRHSNWAPISLTSCILICPTTL